MMLSNNLERKVTLAQNSFVVNVNSHLKEDTIAEADAEQNKVFVKVKKVYGCNARLAFKNQITKTIKKVKKVRNSK